jgi:hypothetical protein
MRCAVLLILVIFFRNSSSKLQTISDCGDRDSSCVIFYCDQETKWPRSEEEEEGCIDPEKLCEKFEEISFIRASQFSTDSSTGKFVRELASKNDSIRRKMVTAQQQLSHLMMHKIGFLVNGVWLEHDVDESLFPIVSIRNSTENELEVLYLDCSLADINLQFLDLFDFTSSFIFWCYFTEGIGIAVFLAFFIRAIECPTDKGGVPAVIFWMSVGHISLISYFFTTFLSDYLNFFANTISILTFLYM